MTETKFTPGPWGTNKFGTQVVTGDSWSTICVLKGSPHWKDKEIEQDFCWQIQLANANLIAAAPDLYEVLSALFDVKVTHLSVDSLMRIQPRALEALAKARGEHE